MSKITVVTWFLAGSLMKKRIAGGNRLYAEGVPGSPTMLHFALLIPFLAAATPGAIAAQEASNPSFAEEQRIQDAEVQQLREEMLVRLLQPKPLSTATLAAIPEELGFDEEARSEWAAQCERYQSRWLEDG